MKPPIFKKNLYFRWGLTKYTSIDECCEKRKKNNFYVLELSSPANFSIAAFAYPVLKS